MSKVSSKHIYPQIGFESEPDFVSVSTTLRKMSGDDTVPQDAFVSVQKDLYDLITPDYDVTKGGVVDLKLSDDKLNLIIKYGDSSQKNIPLGEKVLYQAYFDKISYLIYLIFKDGSQLTIDLNDLIDKFATKEDVVNIVNNTINKGIENIKWLNF